MTFEKALKAMKKGEKVKRNFEDNSINYLFIKPVRYWESGKKGKVYHDEIQQCFGNYEKQKYHLTNEDLLATDWEIYDEKKENERYNYENVISALKPCAKPEYIPTYKDDINKCCCEGNYTKNICDFFKPKKYFTVDEFVITKDVNGETNISIKIKTNF